jgi:hypothetical protein
MTESHVADILIFGFVALSYWLWSLGRTLDHMLAEQRKTNELIWRAYTGLETDAQRDRRVFGQ